MHSDRRPPADLYSRIALTVIALSLAVIAIQHALSPAPVQAQSDSPSLYVEPGVTSLVNLDGSSAGTGKVVIDLRSGEIWGYPTIAAGAVYPIGGTNKPPVVKPIYLGKFDFTAMRRSP